MPQNKRESLIFTVMMCFFMVFVMSIYNVSVHMGGLSLNSISQAWLGFPFAFVCAMLLDWFLVSPIAKKFAFRFLVKPGVSSPLKMILAISGSMVVLMVLCMSLYGSLENCLSGGSWQGLFSGWLHNIPVNFIMALPLQLLVAGPIVRGIFRRTFPVGSIN